MTDAVRRGNAIELGPTLREARRISRKLNDPTWMEKMLSELGEAITFAKDHYEDWQRVLIDTFDDGLPWGQARSEDGDTLIKFLKNQGLSYRDIVRLLSVSRGKIYDVLKLNPPRK